MGSEQEETNSVCQVRMNEFCATHMKDEQIDEMASLTRPRCSVSPIDFSLTGDSSACVVSSPFVGPKQLHLSHIEPAYSSPFHLPTTITTTTNTTTTTTKLAVPINKHLLAIKVDQQQQHPVQFQSTPNNKPLFVSNRVNFHSIAELSTSSVKLSSENSSLHDSGYASISSLPHTSLSSSSFNESLRNLSESMSANKENVADADDSTSAKVVSLIFMLCSALNSLVSASLFIKIKRKPRTSINKQQKEILEYAYKMKPYPDSNEIEYLCQLLGFEENVIRVNAQTLCEATKDI